MLSAIDIDPRALDALLLALAWLIREVAGYLARKRHGYDGFMSLRPPPNQRITPVDGTRRRRKSHHGD